MITLRPDRLVAGGEAMGRDPDGRVVFVRGALPGELVTVEVEVERRDFARGRVDKVLEASSERVVPSCVHRRAGCGGCGWMHLAGDTQGEAKVEIVRESLRRIGRLDPDEVDRIVHRGGAVAGAGSRTSLRVVGAPDRRPSFRRESSDECVPVDSCEIAHPNLERILRSLEIEPGVEVELRTSVATGAVTARWKEAAAGRVHGLPVGVHVGDRAWLVETIAGHELRVSAASFFQSSTEGAELLVAAVRRAAPELAGANRVLDAYGGVGLFAVAAAATATRVIVLESARSSCYDAEHNLAGRDARVVRREVGHWQPDADAAVEIVIADPARPGLGKPGVRALVAAAAPLIVLVSCDPASLARDTALLGEAGYRPAAVEVLDLFPHTPHVETVTRFVRSAGGAVAGHPGGDPRTR
jgi:23S rRNA (uracil1939-C5)-methyltransferase